MRDIRTIARKELQSYFNSPVAYIVMVSYLLISGWMFMSALFLSQRADVRPLFQPSPFSPTMLLVIIVPAITMRLIAEEKKTGTLELLSTLPIRHRDIILGKFFGAWGLVAVALTTTFAYAATVASLGDLHYGPVVSGYVGLFLFAGALIAIGLLCSCITENQIVAFIISFIVSATLYFLYWLQLFVPHFLAPAIEFISVSWHLENMARGVIDSRDVLYYGSLISGALILATRSLSESQA